LPRTPAHDLHPVIPGAEPWSAEGGPHGALVLHGFTGNPVSMRGMAEAFAAAGFAVEMPRLPGHGTHIDDMLQTGFDDWRAEAERAYQALAARCDKVIIAALSMGGALSLSLTLEHPEVAGIVCVNTPAAQPPELADGLRALVEAGTEVIDAVGGDIADPEATEMSYDKTPLCALLSLVDAGATLWPRLADIRCPALLVTSRQDHVVNPGDSDTLAAALGGSVERLWLERSYHVATVDYDKQLVFDAAVAFAKRVTAG
jgi:carboxylesterase